MMTFLLWIFGVTLIVFGSLAFYDCGKFFRLQRREAPLGFWLVFFGRGIAAIIVGLLLVAVPLAHGGTRTYLFSAAVAIMIGEEGVRRFTLQRVFGGHDNRQQS